MTENGKKVLFFYETGFYFNFAVKVMTLPSALSALIEPLCASQMLKGNLHTHTNASDGRYPVSDVVRIYKEKGYDFLGISDHDVYFDKEIENEDLLILHG